MNVCLRREAVHLQTLGVRVLVTVNTQPTVGLWSFERPALRNNRSVSTQAEKVSV